MLLVSAHAYYLNFGCSRKSCPSHQSFLLLQWELLGGWRRCSPMTHGELFSMLGQLARRLSVTTRPWLETVLAALGEHLLAIGRLSRGIVLSWACFASLRLWYLVTRIWRRNFLAANWVSMGIITLGMSLRCASPLRVSMLQMTLWKGMWLVKVLVLPRRINFPRHL